jgi:hypothetical protein
MTEDTPFHPSSKKDEVRAQIATMLLNKMKNGTLTALIARAADLDIPLIAATSLDIRCARVHFEQYARQKSFPQGGNDSPGRQTHMDW